MTPRWLYSQTELGLWVAASAEPELYVAPSIYVPPVRDREMRSLYDDFAFTIGPIPISASELVSFMFGGPHIGLIQQISELEQEEREERFASTLQQIRDLPENGEAVDR